MPMKLRDAAGNSRNVLIIKARDAGGTLRTVQQGKMRDENNVLRTFYAPLSVGITPSEVDASAGSFNASMTVAGGPLTAVPIGGVAPFTYLWAWKVGGSGITISNPTTNSAGFSASVPRDQSKNGIVEVTVTDANGQLNYAQASVTLTHIGYA